MKKNKISIFRSVTFMAIGAYIEEFLTELISSGIKVKDILIEKGVLYARVRRKDYKKIRYYVKKNNIKIKIHKKHGINFKFINKKNSGIIIGIIFISLLISVLQNYIWKINIYGLDELTENEVLKTISKTGIYPGLYTKKIDINTAENTMKLDNNSISWINIEVNGSRVDVYINEDKNFKKKEISLKNPCNIIAAKSGIIVETEVYSGTLIYNKGSGVSKGNVIVSGVVNDGADNITVTHANAKIIADFNETVSFRQDFNTREKITNKIFEEKEILLFGFVIPITEKITDYENSICEEYISNCYFFKHKLPWKIKTNKFKKYETIEVKRTIDDASKILNQKLELYCENFFSDYEVLGISKKIEYDDKGLTMTATFNLRGNIAIKQEIMQ